MIKKTLTFLIKFYQLCISPFLGNCCRFYPSCSDYAIEAIEKHGAAIGLLIAMKRILRCGPWNKGGIDKVP